MPWPTHEVTNQVPPLENLNLFECDPALAAAVQRTGAGWHAAALSEYGARLTQPEVLADAALANRHPPELVTHDARGMRIDAIEFHPSWDALMGLLRGAGLHALPFAQPRPGAMAARAAGFFLHGQVEAGTLCPATMTLASIPVLAQEPALFPALRDKLYASTHDPRRLPVAGKTAMLVGMGLTEKQGGSDLRAITTTATPESGGGRGAAYRLVGHKWFFSVPQSDAHLVLARTPGSDAPSCFYVPRILEDGRPNTVIIQRLKDKLGNRSNASAEVEFMNAHGIMVAEEGRGIPTLIGMAAYTRLDCVIGSAALMRAALVQALHHARHRHAFGRALAEQPLMRAVLADLAIESEAATCLLMRLASAFDAGAAAPLERAWRRLVMPAAKAVICKKAIEVTAEAMEVTGGNGYIEPGVMARLYREAPVNSIWEGSGNVMCLDVLRGLQQDPEAAQALRDGLVGASPPSSLARAAGHLARLLADPVDASQARCLAQQLVRVAQGSVLCAAQSGRVDEFLDSRFGPDGRARDALLGSLPPGIDAASILGSAALF